jgi:hypothetical protein
MDRDDMAESLETKAALVGVDHAVEVDAEDGFAVHAPLNVRT